MKETYRLTADIRSTVGESEECETYTMRVKARLDITGGSHTLSFTEEREGGRVFTTLTYTPGRARVHMKSRGGVKSEMIFDPATPHVSRYEVAPLSFELTVRSREVRAHLDGNGGEIFLSYTRELAGDSTPVVYHLVAVPEEDV